jgi:hypothetical protein
VVCTYSAQCTFSSLLLEPRCWHWGGAAYRRGGGLCRYILMWKASCLRSTGKHQEVESSSMQFSWCQNLGEFLGAMEKFVFEVKKLSNRIKDWKTVRSQAQIRKYRPLLPKNMSPPQLQGLHWRRMGHRQRLSAFVALEHSCLSWLKLGFPARWRTCTHLHFPYQKNCCTLANFGFDAVFAAPKLTGLRQIGCISTEAQCYGSIKNQPSEGNPLATAGC